MPGQSPDFADIYAVTAVLVADAHRSPRRCAVVQAREDHVTVLGRTTQLHEYNQRDCLLSSAEPSCGLDKDGMYSTRYQHSVAHAHFSDEQKCAFYGTLGADSSARLLDYWERQLGLR